MNDQPMPLAKRLLTTALFDTDEPSAAVGALIGAACAILLAQFPPQVATGMIERACAAALAIGAPVTGEVIQ